MVLGYSVLRNLANKVAEVFYYVWSGVECIYSCLLSV